MSRTNRFLHPVSLAVAASFLGSSHCLQAQCEHEKIVAGDPDAKALFGSAVAIDGDTIAIGAPFDDQGGEDAGAVYVFVRVANSWSQVQKLTASDAATLDEFGTSVDIEGDVLVVGSKRDDDAAESSGSAYVFRKVSGTWGQEAKLVASDAAGSDLFGTTVAVHGDLIAVGAPLEDDAAFNAGAAYAFRRTGGVWMQEAKLKASDSFSQDQFGASLGIGTNEILIGARSHDLPATDAGACYVFAKQGATWSMVSKLTALDAQSGDEFGRSVSLNGDLVLVGAAKEDEKADNAGAGYVFRRSGTTWTQEAKLMASDGASGDSLGWSTAIEDDYLAIGSVLDDDLGNASGSVYVFHFDGTLWTELHKLVAEDGAASDQLGGAVDLSGSFVVAGAKQANPVLDDEGAVYVFAIGTADASWSNYGSGWPGTLGIPSLELDANPVVGTSLHLLAGNSDDIPTIGILLIGLSQATIPTSLDGTILVLVHHTIALPLQVGVTRLSLTIPCNHNLVGLSIYLQDLVIDPGASQGLAFSPGLQMNLGF